MSELEALPEGWELAKLEDVCWKITDGTHKTPNYRQSGVRFISIKNIKPFLPINWDSYVKFISREEHEALSIRCNPEFGDILFPRIGTLGYAKRIDFKEEVSLFVGLGLLKPIHFAIDSKYLEFWMNHPLINKLSHEKANGTGRLTLPLAESNILPVPLAPRLEQTRIVEKLEELLSDLDNGVAELKAAQIKLAQYRQSLLKSAVEGSLTAEWRSKNQPSETGQQLLQRILTERRQRWEQQKRDEFEQKNQKPPKDWQLNYPEPVKPDTSELPELPEGWVWASIDQLIAEIEAGKSFKCLERPPQGKDFGVLKVSAVTWGEYNEEESKTCLNKSNENSKILIKEGDFLFSRANTTELVGACVIAKKVTKNIMLSDKIWRILFVEETLKYWVLQYLRGPHGRTQIELSASGNQASMKNISQEKLKCFSIPIASLEEIYFIGSELGKLFKKIDMQTNSNLIQLKQADAQRKNLLKDAFSGKLVPQDPSDEPSSALLEKIKAERAAQAKQPKPKQTKKKAINKASLMDTLFEVLKANGDWMDAQEAFRACGVTDGTETDRIEELYAELRSLDKAQKLLTKRSGNNDMLKLKEA